MIHHVAYFHLESGADQVVLEELVRVSRSQLLRIPEVLAVSSGRNIDPDSPWQFYFSIEVDTLEKLRFAVENPYYVKLLEHTLQPRVINRMILDYELHPSRDLKYS